uniref:DUF547 domain-containing protein n=1 Tax=Kalanchoe fedtschenkoi TaxID=63787 RepID=A0A7N0T3M5_KALFE
MNGDGVSWGSSLKPLMRSMEANQAPRHKRSFSDVPDLKLGEDVKECIFAAPPLRRKPGMGHDKCSPGSWEKPACGPEVGAQDQQKPAEDLIKEIATLEMQVAQLEQHLLSLYRKKFDQQVEPNSARFLPEEVWRGVRERRRDDKLDYSGRFADPRMVGKSKEFQSARFMSEQRGRGGIWTAGDDKMNYSSRHADHRISSIVKNLEMEFNSARFFPELRGGGAKTEKDMTVDLSNLEEPPVKKGAEKWGEQKILDSSINRTNSSLSQHLAAKYSTIQRIVAEAAQSEHSLPLSMFEAQDATLGASFNAADSRRIETVPETPNWLSEEMVRCISAVYCKLADPPLSNQDRWASPFSFSSAAGEFSPEDHSLGSHLENSFFTEKSRFSGTHCTMIEVKQICQDGEKLKDADHTLLRFRALVLRLDKADPRKLKHRQKLAFWINVHNALVMHAFLVYGIPQNSLKRMSLVLKAAYNVGGQTVNVEMIQRSLLGCRLPRPGQVTPWSLDAFKNSFDL